MDPMRWQRIELICFDALDRSPETREAFLAEQCGDDANLRREVISLLSHIETDPSFLERPIVDFSKPDDHQPSDPIPANVPESIGGYRILRQLGRGGMGEVYLGLHQVEDVQQHVAIKVVRRGSDGDDVLRRFRLERRILAGLNHPNIARLLDAGATEDGRPYFVMEHVEGDPIDGFCDGRRLSIDQRLQLFLVICDAVQHAHQNLVVHRDLKPGNILVSDGGVPKLLDFGIGKVLDHSDSFGPSVETRTNVRMLTPEYAAPEQIGGAPVTTATDVYALGVLLYEILTGRHPYVTGGEPLPEIERIVLNVEPRAPSESLTGAAVTTAEGRVEPMSAAASQRSAADVSQLRRRLSGDLDNIVLKALRKEPERRYPSAAALGDDIRRHLRGLPVTARPDTFAYRTRKFVRRHAAVVAAVTVTLAALVVTTAVTLLQSRRVALESQRVILERDKALEVQSFLMEMFGTGGADQAVGDTVTARQLLDRQAALLDEAYGDRPELKADMLMVLADGYDRLAFPASAEPLAREALSTRREILGDRHPDTAASMTLLGWITRQAGRPADALPLLREAVNVQRAAGDPIPLSRSLNDMGVILVDLADYDSAGIALSEALEIRRTALGDAHRSVGITANNLASLYARRAELPDAVETQELAVRALSGSVGPDHHRTLMAMGNLATFRYMSGDVERATQDYQTLLDTHSKVLGRNHVTTSNIILALANVIGWRASQTASDSLFDHAIALVEEGLHIREDALGSSHPSVAGALTYLANTLRARGDLDGALAAARRSLQIHRDAYGEIHESMGDGLSQVADILWRQGHAADAVDFQRRAVVALNASIGGEHPKTAHALSELCNKIAFEEPTPEDALPICARADDALRNVPSAPRGYLPTVRLWLAKLYIDAEDYEVADSILVVVREAAEAGDGPSPNVELLDELTRQLAAAQ